jgi:hypothetical protein
MDLPWGLTNTSGHLPLITGFLELEYSSRHDNDEILVIKLESTAAPSRKAKRRIRRRQRSGNNTRLSKTPEKSSTDCLCRTNTERATGLGKSQTIPSTLSFSSWGQLDTNSAHFKQLMKKDVSPAQPTKDNVQDRLTRKSSWALLEIELDDEVDARGHVDCTPRNKRGASVGLNMNSGHSRSSWAGLDIFGEMDIKGYQFSAQDETECAEDIGSIHPAGAMEAESDAEDEGEDDESDGPPQEQVGRRSWPDFDLDEMSDSESESWVSEDDASDSEEGGYESDTGDDLAF